MSNNDHGSIQLFIDRISSARKLMDEANSAIATHLDSVVNKNDAIQGYCSVMQKVLSLLMEAREPLDTILGKLKKANLNAALAVVTDIKGKLNKVITDCSTLVSGHIENDFLEIHLNLISDIKIEVHAIHTNGCGFLVNSVRSLICAK